MLKCPGQNNIMVYTVPHLLDDLGLSHGMLGALFSLATISSGLAQQRLGKCVDRFGGRVCIPITHFCLFVILTIFSSAQRFAWKPLLYAQVVFVFLFLRGLSLGVCETYTSTCVQQWFVSKRGRAVALLNIFGQIGTTIAAPVISSLVRGRGWRFAATCGSLANLAWILPAAFLLRRSPESCGLLPDGADPRVVASDPGVTTVNPLSTSRDDKVDDHDIGLHSVGHEQVQVGVTSSPCANDQPAADVVEGAMNVEQAKGIHESGEHPLPAVVGLFLAYTYLWALVFGGCDFYTVDMIKEAGGIDGGIDVAVHFFVPLGITTMITVFLVGEALDRYSCGIVIISMCAGFAGIGACVATNLFVVATTPVVAACIALLRGFIGGVYATLIPSGLVFLELGVSRARLGDVLGMNSRLVLFGTGTGPLLYGVSHDLFAGFQWSLHATSLPLLFIGLLLICHGVRALRAEVPSSTLKRPSRGYSKATLLSPSGDNDLTPSSLGAESIGKNEERNVEEASGLDGLGAPG